MKVIRIIAMIPVVAIVHKLPYNLIFLVIQGTAALIYMKHVHKQ